jgi:hypothetical protein
MSGRLMDSKATLRSVEDSRARAFATPGMIDAYNAGLSLRVMSELWDGLTHHGIKNRLINSGVAMRPSGSWQTIDGQTIAYHRKVARAELFDLVKNPVAMASPGMVEAYNSGLSIRTVGSMWGGMHPGAVHLQLRRAGVMLRSAAESMRLGKP